MVVRVRSSPFRTLTNGNPELSTLTSDIPLGYLNSHKRNPELSTLTSDIPLGCLNSHKRNPELSTLTSDIPLGCLTSLWSPLGRRGPLPQSLGTSHCLQDHVYFNFRFKDVPRAAT